MVARWAASAGDREEGIQRHEARCSVQTSGTCALLKWASRIRRLTKLPSVSPIRLSSRTPLNIFCSTQQADSALIQHSFVFRCPALLKLVANSLDAEGHGSKSLVIHLL